MAKAKSVKLMKATKGAAPRTVKSLKVGAAAPGDFVLFDNQDDTFSVEAVDAAGNPLDISSVATLGVTSSDTSKMTVDAPTGMTVAGHALAPTVAGSPITLTFTATWNDGSVGPFSFVLPVDITGTVATGLTVTPGTPTTR